MSRSPELLSCKSLWDRYFKFQSVEDGSELQVDDHNKSLTACIVFRYFGYFLMSYVHWRCREYCPEHGLLFIDYLNSFIAKAEGVIAIPPFIVHLSS